MLTDAETSPSYSALAGRLTTAALLAASPVLRVWVNQGHPAHRLAAIRRFVPGETLQISEELIAFGALAARRSPVAVCEIGTYNGGTSLFLSGIPSVRQFVGMDLRPFNRRIIRALAPRHVDITILKGSSRDLRESVQGPFDVLFIDGDHRYEGVRADFFEYRDLVNAGGLIAFHDIMPDRGKDAWTGGVPRVWQELKDGYRHWEFVADRDQDGFGIGVLEC